MWFLARKEITRNPTRFALFAGLVGLVAFLVFVMTGLSTGLGEANVSGLRALTADAPVVAFAPSVQRSLGRSDVDAGDRAALAAIPGVVAVDAIGQSMVNLTTPAGTTIGVALLGATPGTPGLPNGTGTATATATGTGTAPGDAAGIVLDTASQGDLHVGDVVHVQPGGRSLTVTGFADLGSLQHAPVAATDLATWQRVRYGAFASDTDPVPDRASAFLLRVEAGRADEVRAAVDARGLDAATTAEAIAASPGYREETGTIDLIRGFLFGIAALLVGTVFWVLTIQKEGPLAVLRAAGATRRLLLLSYVVQVTATTLVGVGVGLVAASLVGLVMPARAYVLTPADALTAAGLLVVLALVASAASMRRLLTIDPLLSLGRL